MLHYMSRLVRLSKTNSSPEGEILGRLIIYQKVDEMRGATVRAARRRSSGPPYPHKRTFCKSLVVSLDLIGQHIVEADRCHRHDAPQEARVRTHRQMTHGGCARSP